MWCPGWRRRGGGLRFFARRQFQAAVVVLEEDPKAPVLQEAFDVRGRLGIVDEDLQLLRPLVVGGNLIFIFYCYF